MIKKNKKLSYEDTKTPLCFTSYSGGRNQILEKIISSVEYEKIPEIYEFIKTIDMDRFHNLEIAVEIGHYEFHSNGVKSM